MTDVIIIGGGPVGLATASMAAQKGLTVKLFEPKTGVIDKACGEGLMPAAVQKLNEYGINIPTSHVFKGIRYINGKSSADGHFLCGHGMGVRRLVLHNTLREHAVKAGVEFIQQKAKDIHQFDDHVEVDGHSAKYVLAADGLNSPTRSRLNVELPSQRPSRLGVRQHFNMAPWSDYVEVYWSEHAEAYVTPVAEDLVGVAILYYKDKLPKPKNQNRFDSLLTLFPALKSRLEGQSQASSPRGAGPFERRASKHVINRCMLIGDAAGYLDPLTGEGIRLGLDAGEAAINCILNDQPHAYERAWRNVSRRYWWMTDGLLRARRIPIIRRLMVPFLQKLPWVFDRIITLLAKPAH